MANKQDLQNQIKDLDRRISNASDENEKQTLRQQRDSLQTQLDNA
jgi:hypothetical protein